MSCAKTNQRHFHLRIPQNKAIERLPTGKVGNHLPWGGLASSENSSENFPLTPVVCFNYLQEAGRCL